MRSPRVTLKSGHRGSPPGAEPVRRGAEIEKLPPLPMKVRVGTSAVHGGGSSSRPMKLKNASEARLQLRLRTVIV
jgi:hypothetical protein